MLPLEDRVLLEDTLVSLSVDDTVINDIRKMLSAQETEIENHPPHDVQPTWFGGSFTGGTRLATNASQASAIVESEMKNLIAGLRQYRELIEMYADDVRGTDESVVDTNVALTNAASCLDLDTSTTCAPPTEG